MTLPHPGTGITSDQDPLLDQALLWDGQRLGINVISGPPDLQSKEATFLAEPGHFGTINCEVKAYERGGALQVDQL